jgi:hypothetical protein
MERESLHRLGARLRNGAVGIAGLGAFSFIFLPAAAGAASFDLDGDGRQETHLVSECGAWVAFKQTISHKITNGLQSEIVVKWPAAGLVNHPVPKGTTPVIQYETYKSCIPGDDKGVEFRIASKGVRRFERGAPAAVPGFVTRWFVDAVREMELAKVGKALRELALIARIFVRDKPIVLTVSRVAGPSRPGEKFQYRYSVENHSTDGFSFSLTAASFSYKEFVQPGKKWEKIVDSPKAPLEEAAQMSFEAEIIDLQAAQIPLCVLSPRN